MSIMCVELATLGEVKTKQFEELRVASLLHGNHLWWLEEKPVVQRNQKKGGNKTDFV